MNTIIAIIIGAILWQTIAALTCIVTDENEDITLPVCFGVWTFIFWVAGVIYQSIRLTYYRRRYNSYAFYGDGSLHGDGKGAWIGNYCMTPKTAALFRTVDKYGYNFSIQLKVEGKNFKNCPCKCDIVTPNNMKAIGSKELCKKLLDK